MNDAPTATANVTGTIVAVDIPGRLMALRLSNNGIIETSVMPGCRVVLNNEEVRLRLLLAGDNVQVAYFEKDGLRIATEVNVLMQTKQMRAMSHDNRW
jgi:hypothetical protein